jgi:uncharacterized protein YndB with AHSA1/START domain
MAGLTFVYRTWIAAPPETVWRALTDGAFTSRYFFGRRVKSDWRPGSRVEYWAEEPGREPFLDVSGEVLEADPPRRLSFTWLVEWVEEARALGPTKVTFELEPAGGTTKLTLTHEDIAGEKWFEAGANGWSMILSNLKSLLETGKTLDFPTPKPPE